MKLSKRDQMIVDILRHGRLLASLYQGIEADDATALALCRALRRIETHMGSLAVQACNVGLDDEVWEREGEKAKKKIVAALLPSLPMDHIHINGDPRGYALKIKSEHCPEGLYRDWGGYGILAPDFRQ